MLKVLKVKRLANKFWNSLILLFLFVSFFSSLKSNEKFEERKKAALYDFNEKLYGQALDSLNAILKDLGKNLTVDQKNEIKLKIAICHFELGQLYKASIILDEFIHNLNKPLTFQIENTLPQSVTWQELTNSLMLPPLPNTKSIANIFSNSFPKTDVTPETIIEFLNNLLKNDKNCKAIISEYLNKKKYSNIVMYEIPVDGTERELSLLARYILESLYPLNNFRMNIDEKINSNGKLIKENEKVTKNVEFYEALYWRSRIDLISGYYGFAKDGFEEILTNLNFDQVDRNIECRFYKAKAKFHLKMNRVSLKELETLNSLYGINEYYQESFFEETYYYLGRSLFELSLFDKAIVKFRTITAGYDNREPRNSLIRNTYYWLGESYYCKGEFDNAIKSISVVLNHGSFKEKEDAHYSIGWAYFEKNDIASRSKAKVHFQTLLKDYPTTNYRLKSELKLAEIEIEEGDADEAEKIIENLHKNKDNELFFQKNINILKQTDFLIGLLYVKKKDYKIALEHFLKSEDTTDQKLKQKIYYQAGICYSNLKNFKNAKSHLTIASEIPASESIKILSKSALADLYYENKNNYSDLDKAVYIYSNLITDYSNHAMNTYWRTKLAEVLKMKNDDDGAISILNNILDENIEEWQSAQMEIGNILMESSPPRYKEAVDHFKLIIPSFKNKELQDLATLKYGISLQKIDKDTDAVQVLQGLIKSSQNENVIIDAYQYCAKSFLKEKDLTNALKNYEESISKYPNQRNINQIRAESVKIYHELQDYDNAIKHLTEILKNEPDIDKKAEALYKLAGYDIQLQKNNEVKEAKIKLLKIVNEYSKTKIAPTACFDLASLYSSQGQDSLAIESYKKAISDFNDPEIAAKSGYLIGQYYYDKQDYENAISFYEKINLNELAKFNDEKSDKVILMLTNKADCYFLLKKFPIAKDEYMGLIRRNSDEKFFKMRYAKSCLESKLRLGDAISIIEKIPADQQSKETEDILELLKNAKNEKK